MAILNYVVLTSAQRDTAEAFNAELEGIAIWCRPIDSATPGSGINLNENATGHDVGDPVALTGMFVAPVNIVNDPDWLAQGQDAIAFLLTLPWCLLENETIFLPPDV